MQRMIDASGLDDKVRRGRSGLKTRATNEKAVKTLTPSSIPHSQTALTQAIVKMKDGIYRPTYADALAETETIATACVSNLLTRTGVAPTDVDAVITACSCFAPTPSMAAMLVNRFKMRSDVLTFALAGQGCGASVLCVDLAARLLATLRPGANVIIFNHENITHNWYQGNNRSMLVTNCLFRASGAATMMTNSRARAAYELTHVERTITSASDDAFNVMGDAQDDAGRKGIYLSKGLVGVAAAAIRQNVTHLAPSVLPLGELAKAARDRDYVPRFDKVSGMDWVGGKVVFWLCVFFSSSHHTPHTTPTPFPTHHPTTTHTQAFDHFLMHAGSTGVLKAIQSALRVPDAAMRPSFATLARFGNSSSASTWITLANVEASARGVKKGDRLWQLGLGGGFKCLSATWRAVRDVKIDHAAWGPTVGMTAAEVAAFEAREAGGSITPPRGLSAEPLSRRLSDDSAAASPVARGKVGAHVTTGVVVEGGVVATA